MPRLAAAAETAPPDPRPALIELARTGRGRDALAVVDRELAERPAESRALGLEHFRGHLLEELNQPVLASKAYAEALSGPPKIAAYSRYRLALAQERGGHPEVAAGLLATLVKGSDLGAELLPRAVRLFERCLSRGGDCRLLPGIDPLRFPPPERRALSLAQADCALRTGDRDLGRALLARLLSESEADEWALAAAERAAAFDAPPVGGRLALLAGRVLLTAGEPERASRLLARAAEQGSLSRKDRWEVEWVAERARLAMGRGAALAQSAGRLLQLAERAATSEARAMVLAERAEAIERLGQLRPAASAWRAVHEVDPNGRFAASALLAEIRLAVRLSDRRRTEGALTQLAARREDRAEVAAAELFLAVTELARGQAAGTRSRLSTAASFSELEPFASYWRGRAAEIERRSGDAVSNYLELIRRDPYSPLALAARRRLVGPSLAPVAAVTAQRLVDSKRVRDLYDGWLLFGESHPLGRKARANLARTLLADREVAPFLRLTRVATAEWPLWNRPRIAATPEEALLALGLWQDGAPRAGELFARGEPNLAFTAMLELERSGQLARSIASARALRERAPTRLPTVLFHPSFQKALYPLPHADLIRREARLRGVDPLLLAALLREASGFDRERVRGMGRGLSGLTPAVAQRVAARAGLPYNGATDLSKPDFAIAIAAARLGEIAREVGGAPHRMITAWVAAPSSLASAAGVEKVRIWQAACVGQEPEEFWAQIPDGKVRERALAIAADWAHYRELYAGGSKP